MTLALSNKRRCGVSNIENAIIYITRGTADDIVTKAHRGRTYEITSMASQKVTPPYCVSSESDIEPASRSAEAKRNIQDSRSSA